MSPEIAMHAPLPRSARIALVALATAGLPAGLAIIRLTWWGPWSWLGAALVSFSPMLAALLYVRLFRRQDLRPANRRYQLRQSLLMVAYFVVLMGATLLHERGLTTGPIGYLIAVAPALPLVGVFVAMGRYVKEETDEVMRNHLLTAYMWSGAATLCEATVWGFLETFGKAPNLWMWVVPLLFFGQLAITGPLAARRYR